MKRLFAVLGDRVQRSLSPLLHTAAGDACGLDLAYVPVVCRDVAHFRRAVQALGTLGAVGANVTIPYKQAAADLCAGVSTTAREIGAVNTLTWSGRGVLPDLQRSDGDRLPRGGARSLGSGRVELHGDNTDGPALVRIFASMPPRALRKVQVLGAGGAARAAVWALRALGAPEVLVCARRPEAAAGWASARGARSGALGTVAGVSLVVSALPADEALAGTAIRDWIAPADRPYVYDLAYGGPARSSPLTRQARAAGMIAADGLGMLVEQAALALSLWTGGAVDRIRAAMKDAVELPPTDDPFDSNSGAD